NREQPTGRENRSARRRRYRRYHAAQNRAGQERSRAQDQARARGPPERRAQHLFVEQLGAGGRSARGRGGAAASAARERQAATKEESQDRAGQPRWRRRSVRELKNLK